MKPVPEWRRILRHAWSVRANIFVAICSAAGAALMMVNGDSLGHPLLIPAAAFVATTLGSAGAIVLRVFPQRKMSDDSN